MHVAWSLVKLLSLLTNRNINFVYVKRAFNLRRRCRAAVFIQMSTSRALALPSALPLHLSLKSPLRSGALKLS